MCIFKMFCRGDECPKGTWTYHIHPERDDLVLEGNYNNIYKHRCSKHLVSEVKIKSHQNITGIQYFSQDSILSRVGKPLSPSVRPSVAHH